VVIGVAFSWKLGSGPLRPEWPGHGNLARCQVNIPKRSIWDSEPSRQFCSFATHEIPRSAGHGAATVIGRLVTQPPKKPI